jgi:hypothetical protein
MDPLAAALIAVEENAERLRGPQGPTGERGERGMRGATGPMGTDGPMGDPGRPGIDWRGPWQRSVQYQPDDAVESEGSSYIATVPTKGHKPPGGGWDLLAQKGDKGDPGQARVIPAPASSSPAGPAGEGAVPVGGIIMWSGTIATIPVPDWQLCDGTLNAPGPDLRDKFVVAASVDDAGSAKTNIEGSLKISATQTGATLADHAGLSHANAGVSDHTGLSHDGAVASHADLTHVALSHPAITVVHADHSLASQSHTHASGADVSLPSGSFASTSLVSYPSHTHASAANASAPNASFTTLAGSAPSYAAAAGISALNTITRSVVTTGGLVVTVYSGGVGGSIPSIQSKAGVTVASHDHASTALVSVPSASAASGANASAPSGTVAAATGSRPSLTGTDAAVTVTHADHSIASLSHQAIGTHAGLTHAFTPPAGHGAAGTVTHTVTQADAHAISAHATVPIVPAYYALAFIQRML